MQIISSFHLCSDLVTVFIHYFPTSKLLILSSATLELALICLTTVINCTNSHLSKDVSFATATDMFCSVGHICYLIWFDVSFFSPHKWMAFVHLNKRHVMLYVMLCFIFHTQGGSVLYVGTKFEADSSIRSKVIRGSQISPRPQTPSWGCGTAKMAGAGDVHYLFLQTQFGEDRCTQFRVIVITIYRQDQL